MVEWAEHALLHKINEIKKDSSVQSIEINELEANTAIAQEFIDFLLRLVKDNERLESLVISNIHGLDKPLDKGLFERVATKTDNITIGAMPKLEEDFRASMTECIESFFAASEKLKSVNILEYYQNDQEAQTLIGSMKQSESISSIEHLTLYKKPARPKNYWVSKRLVVVLS